MSDEARIRETIARWLTATKEGDAEALSSMLDDDVLFVVPGQAPFGKEAFLAEPPGRPLRFEANVDVLEVVVNDDWA